MDTFSATGTVVLADAEATEPDFDVREASLDAEDATFGTEVAALAADPDDLG